MELRPFSLKQKKLFDRYAQEGPHELSAYSFINQFVWRCLYKLRYHEARGALCLFFSEKAGCFMPLPPLGNKDAGLVLECFDAMEAMNRGSGVSRIESIEARDTAFFEGLGFQINERFCDYMVQREAIAALAGGKLRHRRNLYNFFTSHYKAVFRDYRPRDRGRVAALFGRWKAERLARPRDRFFSGMLDDNERAFGELLDGLPLSGVSAKVVEVDGAVAAFTSGAPVSRDVFCVNFEIADHRYKGLAQYIFTEFARVLDGSWINMMDDSGIEAIRKAKMLFGDVRRVPAFAAVRRKNEK